jgi:putative endonuclease
MYTTYVLISLKNGKSYVGMTRKKINVRLQEHNDGKTNWTSKNRPFKLIYYEQYFYKKDALLREKFLKSGIGSRLVKAIISEFGVAKDTGRSSDG